VIDRAAAGRLLDLLGGDAHLEMLDERQELLRLAHSRPTYQHSEQRLTLRVCLLRNGRSGWGTLGTLDEAALTALRARLEAALARVAPGDEELAHDEALVEAPETSFAATLTAGADERVSLLCELDTAFPEAELGGSLADTVVEHVVASSTGIFRRETRTRSAVQLIASADGRTSFARVLHRDRSAVLAELPAAEERLRAALADMPSRRLESGSYRAVLAPQAVAGVLGPFAYATFSGRAVAAGETASSSGAALASSLVDLVDDARDPAGLPTGFDCEGVAKRCVTLLAEGVPAGAVHDAASARATGAEPTGHAVPPAWRFGGGPSVSHLVMAAGEASDEELLAACGAGLYVQRVDYLRVVQPRQLLASGSSRDGTLWVEDGRVVARLPQFRFTVRLDDVLRAVELVGARRERSEFPFLESVVAPGAVLSAFPVDALTVL
jgi:predicted Zn-dependent protease